MQCVDKGSNHIKRSSKIFTSEKRREREALMEKNVCHHGDGFCEKKKVLRSGSCGKILKRQIEKI